MKSENGVTQLYYTVVVTDNDKIIIKVSFSNCIKDVRKESYDISKLVTVSLSQLTLIIELVERNGEKQWSLISSLYLSWDVILTIFVIGLFPTR